MTTVMTAERPEHSARSRATASRSSSPTTSSSCATSSADERRRRSGGGPQVARRSHQKGEYPFTINPKRGINVVPQANLNFGYSLLGRPAAQRRRVRRDDPRRPPRPSLVLAAGPTGCGKTLLITQFTAGGVARGERELLFPSRRPAKSSPERPGWGIDFERAGGRRAAADVPGAGGGVARGPPAAPQERDRRVPARPGRDRQPLGTAARATTEELPRVPAGTELPHQGQRVAGHDDRHDRGHHRPERRPAHVDGRRHDRRHAVRGRPRPRRPRDQRPEGPRLRPRQGHPRLHDRRGTA